MTTPYTPCLRRLGILGAALWLCNPAYAQTRRQAPQDMPASAIEQPVTLEQRQENAVQILVATNHVPAPAEIEVEPRRLENMTAEPPLPRRFVVPPLATVPIVALHTSDPQLGGSIRYAYRSVIGDPSARPDPRHAYLPPLPPGSAYTIAQSFQGPQTHSSLQNRYAVDIAVPENTTVHAARGGIVVAIEDRYTRGGNEPALQDRANQIRILHNDGSMAVYGHLRYQGARVAVGQPVAAGQVIGLSGSTGYSTAPHLHFAVQHNAGMRLESLPFLFRLADGSTTQPREGLLLQGIASGKADE